MLTLAYIYTARLAHVKRATGDVRFKFKALPGLSKTYDTHINDFLAEKKEPERPLSLRTAAKWETPPSGFEESAHAQTGFTEAESGN